MRSMAWGDARGVRVLMPTDTTKTWDEISRRAFSHSQ